VYGGRLWASTSSRPYGENPNGYVAFPATGRIFAFVTADNHKASQTPEDQSAAFRSMIVVSGKHRKEGDKFIIKVDLAWNEGWVASDHAVLQIGRRQAAYRKRSISSLGGRSCARP
jgi:hypothetical protein